jgi:hypothetical protein
MRSSGAKGWPFRMPTDAQKPSVVASTVSVGSSCTTLFSISQKRKSAGPTMLKGLPDMFTKFSFGGFAAWESGYIFMTFLTASTPGLGLPSTRKLRQPAHTLNEPGRTTK